MDWIRIHYMIDNQYANGITANALRLLLEIWPNMSAEAGNIQSMFIEINDKVFNNDTELVPWYFLYEFPITQHIALVNAGITKGYAGFINPENIINWYSQIVNTPGQIGAIPDVIGKVEQHFDTIEINNEDAEKLLPNLAAILGLGLSMHNTLRCILYHGCFLNELIERVRTGDDKALFDAIRIDSTVIGCLSVSSRVSKAALLQDNRFFAKLKGAINGKMAKREQANFQKMRLVFEVLHEAGASHLDDSQLQQLFVEELDLYASNSKGGGNAKALRKFADTYMKKSTTT